MNNPLLTENKINLEIRTEIRNSFYLNVNENRIPSLLIHNEGSSKKQLCSTVYIKKLEKSQKYPNNTLEIFRKKIHQNFIWE